MSDRHIPYPGGTEVLARNPDRSMLIIIMVSFKKKMKRNYFKYVPNVYIIL
jgi:hypothetical protein